MSLHESHRNDAGSATTDAEASEDGAAAAAPGSVEADAAALCSAGVALMRRAPFKLTRADMASPAWLLALVQPIDSPDGDPVWDDRPSDPVVVHSDVLWYQLSCGLLLYPKLDRRGKGNRVSDVTSRWRLLGVRCAGVSSHLELSDRELMEAAYRSVTAEDGTLRRLLGVAEVVHGATDGRLEWGAGPVDEVACDRGRALEEKATWGGKSAGDRSSEGGGQDQFPGELGDAVGSAMWLENVLVHLGGLGLGSSLPADAFLARKKDMRMLKIEVEQRDRAARYRAARVAEGKAVPLDGSAEEDGRGDAAGGAEAEEGAAAAAPSSVESEDDALRSAGEALLDRAPFKLTRADMASPAWLHALVQPIDSPDGDPVWDGRPSDPVVVHSDVLWYQLSRNLRLYRKLYTVGTGTRVSHATSQWRLLGVRCAGVSSHLELSDRELMEAVYRSVTAEDGTLRRLLGVAEVVHGATDGRLEWGAGPVDEAACDRGRALKEKATWEDSAENRVVASGGSRNQGWATQCGVRCGWGVCYSTWEGWARATICRQTRSWREGTTRGCRISRWSSGIGRRGIERRG